MMELHACVKKNSCLLDCLLFCPPYLAMAEKSLIPIFPSSSLPRITTPSFEKKYQILGFTNDRRTERTFRLTKRRFQN